MGTTESFGGLFGKAKRWARQEIANATKVGGDPREHRAAEEANDDLGREIESDARSVRDQAIISAITPQSVKDYQAYTAAQKATRDAETATASRAARAARASDSRVELTGAISGTAEGLAVESWRSEEGDRLFVMVECVDEVVMNGGTVTGFAFAIPDYHGDGTYTLVDDGSFDALNYELYLSSESEGWAFHPMHGPGVITVSAGVADVQLVIGGSGSETIQMQATIALPPQRTELSTDA